MAHILAPSNLVIRQFCLIDIIRGSPDHYRDIVDLVKLLSDDGKIWLEGYSYWIYTFNCLDIWINLFAGQVDISDLLFLIEDIKAGFVKTAYINGNVWYPAPFGDLRKIPLTDDLQNKCLRKIENEVVNHSIVTMYKDGTLVHYTIQGKPIGLNAHIPKELFYVEVRNGEANFKFYNGYENKYKNKYEEIKDIFDTARVNSIKRL